MSATGSGTAPAPSEHSAPRVWAAISLISWSWVIRCDGEKGPCEAHEVLPSEATARVWAAFELVLGPFWELFAAALIVGGSFVSRPSMSS